MMIYNITLNVSDKVHDDWYDFMTQQHIKKVIKTGCFESYVFNKLLTKQSDEEGTTYCVQYRCKTNKELETYFSLFAKDLQKEHTNMFGNEVVAFRSIMKEIQKTE